MCVCVCVCMKSLQNKIGETIAIEYKIEKIAVKIKNYGPHLQCYAQYSHCEMYYNQIFL